MSSGNNSLRPLCFNDVLMERFIIWAMNKSNHKKGEKTFWEELAKRKKFFVPNR